MLHWFNTVIFYHDLLLLLKKLLPKVCLWTIKFLEIVHNVKFLRTLLLNLTHSLLAIYHNIRNVIKEKLHTYLLLHNLSMSVKKYKKKSCTLPACHHEQVLGQQTKFQSDVASRAAKKPISWNIGQVNQIRFKRQKSQIVFKVSDLRKTQYRAFDTWKSVLPNVCCILRHGNKATSLNCLIGEV